MKLLITAASLGTSSSINLGKLCQSDYVSGRINDSFCKLVLLSDFHVVRLVRNVGTSLTRVASPINEQRVLFGKRQFHL